MPESAHELIIMDRTGDSRTEFKPDDAETVKLAGAKFAEMIGQGYFAAVVSSEGTGERLTRTFDPTATKTILYPPLIGG